MLNKISGKIKRAWRIFIGRCALCGVKLTKANMNMDLYFSIPSPYNCNKCNKFLMFGANYGMSRERLRKIIKES